MSDQIVNAKSTTSIVGVKGDWQQWAQLRRMVQLASESGSMSVLDQNALDNIRALQRPGTPDLLGRIVNIFLNETPEGIDAIHQALTAGDLETVRTKAHSIKSSAAYLGATGFSSSMAELERAARESNLAVCTEICKDINSSYDEVHSELIGLQDKAA